MPVKPAYSRYFLVKKDNILLFTTQSNSAKIELEIRR
jgi:hypothetical protein